MLITTKINLDIAKPGILPRVYAVQGEAESRAILFSLTQNGIDWEIPEGVGVAVGFRRSDGTGGVYGTAQDGSEATSILGNLLSVLLIKAVCADVGPVVLNVEIGDGSRVLATWPVTVEVRPNPGLQSLDGIVAKGPWPPNKQLGTDADGSVVAVDPEPRPVELDISAYGDGVIKLAYSDGSTDAVAVEFDSRGRPVCFVNGDESLDLVWPAVEVE